MHESGCPKDYNDPRNFVIYEDKKERYFRY